LRIGSQPITYVQAGAASVATLLVVLALRFIAVARARSTAGALSKALAGARRLHDACQQYGQTHSQTTLERIKSEFGATLQSVDQQLKQAQVKASNERVSCRMDTDERTVRL